MKYVPYHELSVPNIIVDGAPNAHTKLALSHWPNSPTPPELKADLSAQIVFRYLENPKFHVDVEAVSNNHFDEDGLISLYTILNPEKAFYFREVLIDIAAAGDFGTYRFPEAARAAFTIAAYGDSKRSPLASELFQTSYSETTASLYRELLQLLPEVILDPEKFRRFWKPEEADLLSSEAAIEAGAIQIEEIPQIDLSIVTIPKEMDTCHPFALHNATERFRILMMKGQSYEFRYRYESWVQYVSKRVMPRIDLTVLANELSCSEKNGTWKFDGVDEITPRMILEGERESSISPDTFRRHIVEFLQDQESSTA